MREIARQVREATRRGDQDAVVRLIGTRSVDLWFAMPPDELSGVIAQIAPERLRLNPVASLVARMLAPVTTEKPDSAGALPHTPDLPAHLHRWHVLIDAAQARVIGEAGTAYEMLAVLPDVTDPIPTVIDPSNGIRSLYLKQAAIAAALDGRLHEALSLYARVLRVPLRAGFEFFAREAHLRSALIHGLCGDPVVAQAHLREARELPRSDSWVERSLDSEQTLVVTMLDADSDPGTAFERVLQLTYGQMGEIWPFHLLALQRLGVVAERRSESRARLESLVAAGFGATGSGLQRSAPSALLALESLLSGNVPRAKQEWQEVDDRSWPIWFIGTMIALASGASRTAIRDLTAVKSMTKGLRQAERRRTLLLSLAHCLTEDPVAATTAVDHLSDLNPRSESYEAGMLRILAPGVFARLAERIPGLLPAGFLLADTGVLEAPSLTRSEAEVLAGLARGETRDQIAQALFRSVNTVKSQQRSLYRKLGVTSAAEAVRHAAESGYL
ncbi:helix-turn-helix transcriptional regulator [Microbacterium panaciterrae]